MAIRRSIRAALACACALTGAFAVEPPPASPAPMGQLRGSVYYGRHSPAVGAVVLVHPDGATTAIRLATTGENGGFAFDKLDDGAYRIEVRREGYVPVVKEAIAVKAPFRAVVELLLARGDPGAPPSVSTPPAPSGAGEAEVAGVVRLASGPPVPEATIRLTRVDARDDPRTVLTAADGTFAIAGLAAGAWRLEILGAGLLPMRATLDLAAATRLEAQLTPQPPSYQPFPEDLIVPEEAIPPKEP